MSRDTSAPDLSQLETSDLLQLELIRASVNEQLYSDRGGVVMNALLDYYVETSSSQAAGLLCSIREPLDKVLLDRLMEGLARPGRQRCLDLLGQLLQRQPPWIHKASRHPILPGLLRCLKTDSDAVVLVTGVLVLVSLLPIIPQTGKQHIYDFFDVFGRLATWSIRNPAQVPGPLVLHLQGAVYSLFHRLYGMFPCSFMSYLRLHYSMKENLHVFTELVQPMLWYVRVHPELVTGTQEYELDPSRWRCNEVHDIVIECSRVCLDPREASSEDDIAPYCPGSSAGHSPLSLSVSQLAGPLPYVQLPYVDPTWSPSSQCGMATPPASPPPSSSQQEGRSPFSATVSVAPPESSAPEGCHHGDQPMAASDRSGQPITEERAQANVGDTHTEEVQQQAPSIPSESVFSLALPGGASSTAPLLSPRSTQVLQEEEPGSPCSPLEALDQLLLQGQEAHLLLSRLSGSKADWSHSGGKQHSMKAKGPAQGEELQVLHSQLLLVHSQLQYERFKRQQHAVRNRRLLRRVLSSTALEEHAVSMKAQLSLQEAELASLRDSLGAEQQRYVCLQSDSQAHVSQLHTHTHRLQAELLEANKSRQEMQSELQDCRCRLADLEAELQKANNEAYNAEHQLAQMSLKLSSSELQQQQMFLLNKQMLLLRETNRLLQEDRSGDTQMEVSIQKCIMGKQQSERLEAANQRQAELEAQVVHKDALVQQLKSLQELTRSQARCELEACECRCEALKSITMAMNSELMHLYSLVDQDTPTQPPTNSVAMPTSGVTRRASSSPGVNGGGVVPLPLSFPSHGSFLEQRAGGPPRHQGGLEEELVVGGGEQEAREGEGGASPRDRAGEPPKEMELLCRDDLGLMDYHNREGLADN